MQPRLAYQKRNHLPEPELRARLAAEDFERLTISLYRYVRIENPSEMRDEIWDAFSELGVLGRIYIASEGINAQLSVPQPNADKLRAWLDASRHFAGVPWKIGLLQVRESFLKLIIKLKTQIVADGLPAGSYDIENVGRHLSAEEWNHDLADPDTVVVDMRNNYESEVGRFDGAICPDAVTFREELPLVARELAGREHKKIRLYCTGGIRCEKASAYLKSAGFADVGQLWGGIIQYAHETQEKNLESKFKGKNFVFDERLGERITDDVIASCHQCGASCDSHTNCRNSDCNKLFIQCPACSEKFECCCSEACRDYLQLDPSRRAEARAQFLKSDRAALFRSRMGYRKQAS